MGADYLCDLCHRPQVKGRSDEAARAEYREHFPEDVAAGHETGTVCDDCWRWMYDPVERRIRVERFGSVPPWPLSDRR